MKENYQRKQKVIFLTNNGIILREVSDLVNVNVSTVAVIQLDEDVVIVVVRSHHRAGVEVAQLAAPVNTDPPPQLQLRDRLRSDLHNLRNKTDFNQQNIFIQTVLCIYCMLCVIY